jgi:hypothetical protein
LQLCSSFSAASTGTSGNSRAAMDAQVSSAPGWMERRCLLIVVLVVVVVVVVVVTALPSPLGTPPPANRRQLKCLSSI